MMTTEQFILPGEKLIDVLLETINKLIESDNYQEVSRREQEIAEKKAALDDMKRKNQMVQDKVKLKI